MRNLPAHAWRTWKIELRGDHIEVLAHLHPAVIGGVVGSPGAPARQRSQYDTCQIVGMNVVCIGIALRGQCRQARASDDVHVLLDSYAVVPVDSTLLFTSLRGVLPKVLLNVDIGDRAVIDRSRCDCAYGRLGCDVRLHTIRSSDKITEFGVTFAVQDVFHVLEHALPRRFGGAAGDYQLVEDRDADGLPRYTIVVDPRLSGINDGDVADTFLREMAGVERHYGFMAAVWARSKILTVRREAPLAGSSGKMLPFYRKG